jgi:hypothetical protein
MMSPLLVVAATVSPRDVAVGEKVMFSFFGCRI